MVINCNRLKTAVTEKSIIWDFTALLMSVYPVSACNYLVTSTHA